MVTVDLPNVTSIKEGVFYRCEKLTNINLPNIISVGTFAFQNCLSLTKVDFLSNVTSIEEGTFYNCTALTTIDLPKVMSIGGNAFKNNKKLKSIIIRTNEVAALVNSNAFADSSVESGIGYIYVPDELVDGYKTATNWVMYADQIKPLSGYSETVTINSKAE